MLFLGNFSRYTLLKIYTKRTKLHHIFLIFSGELAYAPERLNHLAYVCNYN